MRTKQNAGKHAYSGPFDPGQFVWLRKLRTEAVLYSGNEGGAHRCMFRKV